MTAATDAFLAKIKPLAIDGWITGKVLPSITGAQAILESAWGTSLLTTQANNLFGIKASNWTGAIYMKQTLENKPDGTVYTVTADFRAYNNWDESVKDHTAFLQKDRYAPFRGLTDYKLASQSIKDCGYATDVAYTSKLIKLIEAYGLDKWDTEATNQGAEQAEMSYEIEYKLVDYGTVATTNRYIIAHETANSTATIDNEVKYMKTNAANAFVSHFVGGGGRIIQVAPVGKLQYGAGPNVNSYAYAQVELCRANNQATFKKDYAAYIWLLRKLAAECGLPQTLDTSGNGIKTHLWVTNNLGGTDHTDPYGYLSSMGVSANQFVSDVTNGLGETSTVVAYTNRVAVSYSRMIAKKGFSIDSKPYGESGSEWWGNTDDFYGQVVNVVEENGTGEYANTNLGWIDKRALIEVPVRIAVDYNATITSAGYSIDSKPWGEPGFENWGYTDDQLNKAFYFYEESYSGEYANAIGLGWVDKRALTKGIITPVAETTPIVEAAMEPIKEPTTIESIIFLPNGKSWVVYPENGPYIEGDIISLEGPKEAGGLSFKILGDKGGNIVVVDLPKSGVVGLYYDVDKGASITRTYA